MISVSSLINDAEKKFSIRFVFMNYTCFYVRLLALGKSSSVQKTLCMDQLRQMKDGLNYVSTNNGTGCE